MARLDAVVAHLPPQAAASELAAKATPGVREDATRFERSTERRSWKLFSPAKALSLTLLMGTDVQETADPADEKAGVLQRAGRAARLAMSAPEARAALLDLDDAMEPERRLGFVPTSFGTLALQQSAGGTSALRLAGAPTRSFIEISLPPKTAAQTVSEVVLGRVAEKPSAPTAVAVPNTAKRGIERLLSSTPLATGSALAEMLAQISGQREVTLELSALEAVPAALRAATRFAKRASAPAPTIQGTAPQQIVSAPRSGGLARRMLPLDQQLVPEFVAVTGDDKTQLRAVSSVPGREASPLSAAARPVEDRVASQRAVAAIRSLELISQRLQQPMSTTTGQLTIADRAEPGLTSRSTSIEPLSASVEAFAEDRLRIQGIASRVSELEAAGGDRSIGEIRSLETVLSGGGELVALATVAGSAPAAGTGTLTEAARSVSSAASPAPAVRPATERPVIARSGETLSWASALAERAKATAFASAEVARTAVSPKRRALVDNLVGLPFHFDSATTGPLAHLALRDVATPGPRPTPHLTGLGDDSLTLPLLAAERASGPGPQLSVGTSPEPLTLVSVVDQIADQGTWIGTPKGGMLDVSRFGGAQTVQGAASHSLQRTTRRASVLSQGSPTAALQQVVAQRGTAQRRSSTPAQRGAPVGLARFDDTAGRLLSPMVSFIDQASGVPKIIRSQAPTAATGIPQLSARAESTSSPLERVAQRVALQFIGASAEPRPQGLAHSGQVAVQATREQAVSALSDVGLKIPQLRSAVLLPQSKPTASQFEPQAKVPTLVSRILEEVRASSVAASSPISTALSVLNLGAPTSGRDLGVSPTVAATLDAPVFGVPQASSSRTPARSRVSTAGIAVAESVGEQIAQSGRRPEVEALGRVAVRATRELTAVGVPTKKSDSVRSRQDADGWSPILGAGAARSRGMGQQSDASSLGWLQRELSSLVGFDSGYRAGTAIDLQHEPVAVAAAQRLARYIDAEAAQSDGSADKSPSLPGTRAEVVRSTSPTAQKAKVERTTTRLGRRPMQQRTLTTPFVQGQAVQQDRNYVEPWAGTNAPAPPTSIQPLAKTDSQSGHDGDRAETAGAIASPPRDKLAMMAEQIFSIIKSKLEDEATRYGR